MLNVFGFLADLKFFWGELDNRRADSDGAKSDRADTWAKGPQLAALVRPLSAQPSWSSELIISFLLVWKI